MEKRRYIKILKENVIKQEKLVNELVMLSKNYKKSSDNEKKYIDNSARILLKEIEEINKENKELIKNKKINENRAFLKKEKEGFEISRDKIQLLKSPSQKLKQSKINQTNQINKTIFYQTANLDQSERVILESKPSGFSIIASRIFKGPARALSTSLSFLEKDLKQADMPYILTSYISLILFVTFIILFISLCAAVLFSLQTQHLLRNILISLILPLFIFVFMITYPSLQAKSNSKKLEAELPFALSHMAAISSSRIAPHKIFYVMAQSQEYKIFSKQMRKIVNQMNVYGCDLVTALKNVSKSSENRKFSEVLNGIATTIVSGGDLTTYLKEKSKDFLLDYRLSRQKYSTTIGIYSDIYTALLIAAPLILMLVLSIMNFLGSSIGGLSISFLANLGIIIIATLNILFIIFLSLTQPET